MARVVVIGGGLGGMASGARLAKLGHEVTLVEAGRRPGGSLLAVEADGYRWGPATTLLPAVLRDLFRKTGRPLERELELVPLEVLREHRFPDGGVVALPGGSRAAQLRAVEHLGPGLGERWVRYVDDLGADWELVRRGYLETPWDAATGSVELRRRLATRASVEARHRPLRDARLRSLAEHPLRAAGQDPRSVPAWMAVWPFVEQRFGGWRLPGGLEDLATALTDRLRTRKVEVLTSTRATDIVVRGGRAVAVATEAGELAADVVVCAVDPHTLPALAAHVARTHAVAPPPVVHLALDGTSPADPGDGTGQQVWHGDPTIVVRRGVASPATGTAATLTVLGPAGRVDDPLTVLAERGLDLRDRVLLRVDEPPEQQVTRSSGSPWGTRWEGRATVRRRLGPATPVRGVFAAGAHATPGAGVPLVGLSAALVAQVVGPADGPPAG